MNDSPKKFSYVWRENKVLVIALVIFVVLGLIYYFRNILETPSGGDKTPEGVALTPEEEAELLRKMTPSPDAKPTLSDK